MVEDFVDPHKDSEFSKMGGGPWGSPLIPPGCLFVVL